MGNDGGVVAVKRAYMRHANRKAKEEKMDREGMHRERVTTCALSGEPLKEPIVACALGNLYNKQALLEHLLAKTMPERFQHISSLKDVVTCTFTRQSESSSTSLSSSAPATTASLSSGSVPTFAYHCPVTLIEFNGKLPFVVLSSCGCVVSERCMKEVQTTECLVCGKSTADGSLIQLLQSEELYLEGQKRIVAQKAADKQHKKDAKKKKKRQHSHADAHDSEEVTSEAHQDANSESTAEKKDKKKRKLEQVSMRASANAAVSSSATAQEARDTLKKNKKSNHVFASLFSKDKGEGKSDANTLLMAAGGMRYNLS